MDSNEAYALLTKYLKNKNLIKHSLSCEVVMKAIYKHLHKDDFDKTQEETWGITGLLHDVDYELAQNTNQLDKHGLLIFSKEPDVIPQDIAHAIQAHAYEHTNVQPESDMDWGIACCDQLTGLIVAAALIHPDKKLSSLTTEFILNRMKSNSFAKGAKREPIKLCEKKLGIPLNEFIEMSLQAMQAISDKLEL